MDDSVGCPFLRIAAGSFVFCQAVSWGKKADGSNDYMPITRELINYCSGKEYKECPDYRKACILEDNVPLKRVKT
jgi:hypothetical protein